MSLFSVRTQKMKFYSEYGVIDEFRLSHILFKRFHVKSKTLFYKVNVKYFFAELIVFFLLVDNLSKKCFLI